jgi:hypothetical protein
MPSKALQSPLGARHLLQGAELRADPVPDFLAQYHHLEFDHFGGRNASTGFSSIGLVSG